MATRTNKIREVLADARIIVRKYGHIGKYAKHIVALVIRQWKRLNSDKELCDFLSRDPIGRVLGYKTKFSHTIFSKVRKIAEPIMRELFGVTSYEALKGRVVRMIAQDSTDVSAYSKNDGDARYGHRTPSKKEQIASKDTEKSFVFGYKLHMIVDAETELPSAICIAPANRNDKIFFHKLYDAAKRLHRVHLNPNPKYLADAAFDSTDIYQELHYDRVKPLIAINGRGFYKSRVPMDPDYGKRWSVERVFSRLKEVFGMAKNRFVGIGRVSVHIYSCLIAYLLKYG
ncbi:transposase [Candidatus Marsarchaeota archaeon]|nr:transposase [Candidatus Marsarchaeota archaeon]